jgi:bacteriocin-like protein
MGKRQTNTISTSATSRELTEEELDQVVGGSLNFTKIEMTPLSVDTSSATPPAKHWFNGG